MNVAESPAVSGHRSKMSHMTTRLALTTFLLTCGFGCRSVQAPAGAEGPGAPSPVISPELLAHAPEPVSFGRLSLGPMVGDVEDVSAVVWARAGAPGIVNVYVVRADDGAPAFAGQARAELQADLTVKVRVSPLLPSTRYRVVVWQGPPLPDRKALAEAAVASFVTAPPRNQPSAVRLAWGGDMSGQNVCRDEEDGFPLVGALAAYRPDVFIGLGDMIYADDVCGPVGRYGNPQVAGKFGPSTRLEDFRAHWRYNRADPAFRRFLAGVPYLAIWDDHEVMNDFGPHNDRGLAAPYDPSVQLLPLGLRAFSEYNPSFAAEPGRDGMNRSFRWGRHVQLFFLDTRRHRAPTEQRDSASVPKSMLGGLQRQWFIDEVVHSDATWNIVISSVPLAIPTGVSEALHPGRGRDGWANWQDESGYEHELLSILTRLRDAGRRNLIWITTDVHFGSVMKFQPFPESPDFRFHEFVTGPMNAGLFPHPDLDLTLNPTRLFFYGAAGPQAVTSWQEAKRWFNFGGLEIDARGALTFQMINGEGTTVYELRLDSTP